MDVLEAPDKEVGGVFSRRHHRALASRRPLLHVGELLDDRDERLEVLRDDLLVGAGTGVFDRVCVVAPSLAVVLRNLARQQCEP